MEPQIVDQAAQTKEKSPIHQVTPLSKYLAMALFVLMPFLGGWIGYSYAPEKVKLVETIVVKESPAVNIENQDSPSVEIDIVDEIGVKANNQESEILLWQNTCDEEIVKHFIVREENVFYGNKIIAGADPKTFIVIPTAPAPCEEVYARDSKQVFYKDMVITDANPDEFKIYDSLWNTWRIMGPYSRDDKNVYYKNKRIDGTDIESFKAFYEKGYASDNKSVYLDGVIVEGVDANTFDFPVSEGP